MNSTNRTTTNRARNPEAVETVIVGGGQAGLAMGYELQRRNRAAVILEGADRIGDSWRKRWDSLRLFTPAKLSHLPGMTYPASGWTFPTKDEFADYLESYATEFRLDVRLRTRIMRIERVDGTYLVTAEVGEENADERERQFLADHVVLATGAYQEPWVPVFAPDLAPDVRQIHSSAYRNPEQVPDGPVLVAGGGNSGAEIALELAATHEVYIAGKAPTFPVRPGSLPSKVVMPMFLFMAKNVLTTKTPMGRRMQPKAQHHGAPVLRAKPGDLKRAGVRRVSRVEGVRDGMPVLEGGERLAVSSVIWCTGFRSDFSWIDLPSFASGEMPEHERGVIDGEPGMYFIGQRFQYSLSSSFIGGVGQDAVHVAGVIARRAEQASTTGDLADSTALGQPG